MVFNVAFCSIRHTIYHNQWRSENRNTQKRLESSPACFWKYRQKYKANYSFVALSHIFRVIFYAYIPFLKSVWSYLPFRRNKNLPPGGKNENRFSKAISRLRGAKVFLIADLESTWTVTSIGEFLVWLSTFMESYEANPVFDQNPVFVVREQLHRFRTKPTPDSDSPSSKVPRLIGILFFIVCAPLLLSGWYISAHEYVHEVFNNVYSTL